MYRVEDSTGWRGVPCVAQAHSDILKNGFPYDFHKKTGSKGLEKRRSNYFTYNRQSVSDRREKVFYWNAEKNVLLKSVQHFSLLTTT